MLNESVSITILTVLAPWTLTVSPWIQAACKPFRHAGALSVPALHPSVELIPGRFILFDAL